MLFRLSAIIQVKQYKFKLCDSDSVFTAVSFDAFTQV